MPCIVRCLELPSQAAGGACPAQKVAVKLPAQGTAGNTDGDNGQFADIMAALMQLPTDQLNRSLEEQFAWVSVDGGAKEWLPLIDLSETTGENSDMIQLLFNGATGQNAIPTLDMLGTTKQNKGILPINLNRTMGVETGAALNVELSKDVQLPGQTNPKRSDQTSELVANGQKFTDAVVQKNSDGLAQLQPETKATPTAKQEPPSLFQNLNPSTSNDSSSAEQNSSQEQGKTTAQLNQSFTKTPTGAPQKMSGDFSTAQSMPNMEKALDTAVNDQRPEVKMESFGEAESKADASAELLVKSDTSSTTFNPSNQTTSPILDSSSKSESILTAEQSHSAQDASTDSKTMQNDVIRQIVQRMTLHTNGRQSQMNIQLKPEFLGNLRLEVVTENHQVVVRMAAENHTVREMIEHNIHVLRSELEQHGLQVQKVDVYVAQNSDQWKNGRRFQHSHQQGGQSKGRNKDGAASVEMSRDHTMAVNEQLKPRSANRSEVDFFA